MPFRRATIRNPISEPVPKTAPNRVLHTAFNPDFNTVSNKVCNNVSNTDFNTISHKNISAVFYPCSKGTHVRSL